MDGRKPNRMDCTCNSNIHPRLSHCLTQILPENCINRSVVSMVFSAIYTLIRQEQVIQLIEQLNRHSRNLWRAIDILSFFFYFLSLDETAKSSVRQTDFILNLVLILLVFFFTEVLSYGHMNTQKQLSSAGWINTRTQRRTHTCAFIIRVSTLYPSTKLVISGA